MQAAFILYALFTALVVIVIIAGFIIAGVRSLRAFVRWYQARSKNGGNGQPSGR